MRPHKPTRPGPLPFLPLAVAFTRSPLRGGEAEGRVKATVRGGKPALSPSKIPSPTATTNPKPEAPLAKRNDATQNVQRSRLDLQPDNLEEVAVTEAVVPVLGEPLLVQA